MGHHYVPRQHLRRFAIEGEEDGVWMYDKQTGIFRNAGIASVAQERGYYDPDVEKDLASAVEGPGKLVIDKLVKGENMDDAERARLSIFLMIMLTRGPRQRRKSFEHAPALATVVLAETEAEIRRWLLEEPENPLARRRLRELEEARDKYESEIPQNVVDQIRRPFWSDQTVACIESMNWHVIPAAPDAYFVTGDTPAHFFECYGLGMPESEFTVTLSKDCALVGERRRGRGIVYEKPQVQIAKEINRRILSHAERFVFSPRDDDWIARVAQKKDPFLSRIQW